MDNQQASRRRFLIGGMVAGATAVASPAFAKETPKSDLPHFDKIYDVIVVGSGFAGLAAALEARIKGASVLLIEKMSKIGGNSAINGGAFAVAGSPLQEKNGIKDSPELMLQDMLKAGRGLSHPELLKKIVYGTRPAFDFVVEQGVEFKPFVQHFGGHSVPRIMQTAVSTGGGITIPLTKACRDKGVEIHTNAKLEDFVVQNGRVVGVTVRERYVFPNEESGVMQTYGARYGVIMCTGGFSRNVWFRQQQDPSLDERFDSTNHMGATGEGLLKMLKLGGAPVQIDQIQLGPWSSPDEKGFGLVSQFNTIAGFPKGIMIDPRTGKRFCNELADRKARTDAIINLSDDPKKPVYPICFTDSKGVEKAQTLHNGLKYGVIWKFDSLKEMADYFHVPAQALEEQVTQYNEMVKAGKDTQFDRNLSVAITLDKPPFYAVHVWPKVHYCMGGVAINPDAEVIDVTGTVIPGLYAAGEVTGGAHGQSRLGGCAIADGLVFGRIAADSAVKAKPVELK